MSNNNRKMMMPEEALNRFQKPDTALLGLDISSHEYEQPKYGFRILEIGFLIPPEVLCEVMKSFVVYPLPNTSDWMHGLVNLRGNLIPVYDLVMLLGMSEEPMSHDNLLIIDKGPDSVGILIESLPQQCDLSGCSVLSHVRNLPAGLADYVSEAYSKDEVIWLGFNHDEFFKHMMDYVAV